MRQRLGFELRRPRLLIFMPHINMVDPTPFAAALVPPGSVSRSELIIHYAELGYSTGEIRAFLTEIHGMNIRYSERLRLLINFVTKVYNILEHVVYDT